MRALTFLSCVRNMHNWDLRGWNDMTENDEFGFRDEGEAAVAQLLHHLFGPHPVAYLTDACKIMYSPDRWTAGSHLVGHLVRELESMVRTGLLPLDMDQEGSNGTQREEILAIAESLGLASDSSVVSAWTSLDLHKQAHRAGAGFSPPRPIDASFEDWWQDVLRWLRDLLEACRDRHLELTMSLEKLAAKNAPSSSDANRLMGRLSQNPLLMGQILSKVQDEQWLPMLRKHGLFDHVPHPEEMRTWWPPALLLARLSETSPAAVSQALVSIQWPNNPLVLESYLQAVSNLPASDMCGLIPKVVESLGAVDQFDHAETLVSIICSLAAHGHAEEALAVFDLSSRLSEQPDAKGLHAVSNPRTIFNEPYWFVQLLAESGKPLAAAAPCGFLKIMADRLKELTEGAAPGFKTDDGPHYLIHHYREDVAENADDPFAAELNAIISVCRDSMVAVLNSGALSPSDLAELIHASNSHVIERIFMVSMACTDKDCLETARDYLMDHKRFKDEYQEKEFARLAKRYFGSLSPGDKATFVKWANSIPSRHGDSGDSELEGRRRTVWTLRKLRPIRDHLPVEERDHLDALEAAAGEFIDRVDLERRTRSAFVRGPLDADQVAQLDVAEALELVRTWQPTEADPFYVRREGLLDAFRDAIGRAPDRYIQALDSLDDVPFEIRVRILSGIVKGVRDGKPIDWEQLLGHIHWLADVAEHPEAEMPDRRYRGQAVWARQETATLMELGLSHEAHRIPDEFLAKVWDIVKPLLSDCDPSIEREAKRQAPWGAYHIAINSVAGVAWEAAMALLQRAAAMRPAMSSIQAAILSEAEAYANSRERWRLAIHAMLGRLFLQLRDVDNERALGLRPRVFPTDTDDGEYFDAAWEGLILHWTLGVEGHEILRSEYAHAVDRLASPGHQGDDALMADERFVVDLVSHYCSGTINYGDPDQLLERLEVSASPTVVAAIISAFGRTKIDDLSEDGREEWARRALDFVSRRIARHEDSGAIVGCEKELSRLVRWLANPLYDAEDVLSYLTRLIRVARHAPRHGRIIEELSRHAASHPVAVLRVLEQVIEGKPEPWEFGLRAKELSQSLRAIHDTGDLDSRDRVRVVVNRLSAHGIRLDGWEGLWSQ